MEYPIATLLGTVGVAGLLGVYFLNLTGKIHADSYPYLWTNFLGATMACISSIMIGFFPFVVLEGTWAMISAVAIGRRALTSNQNP